MSWTLARIRTTISNEMDLQDEKFITTSEFTDYVNAAIREAEAEIHKLTLEDEYFRSKATITLVQGVGDYELPSDIYASKIRGLYYAKGEQMHTITRFRGVGSLAQFMNVRASATPSKTYKYLLTNIAGTGPRIALAPLAQESGDYVTIWYIRNAKQLVLESDECDIPEFINFVIQYVKEKCINKERMMPDAPPSPALEMQRKLMIDTLSEQVPDGDNEVEQDLSHYEDSI